MSLLGAIAAGVLGITFVVAGASKLVAGPSWSHQARELGAPRWSISPLPWVEMSLGALLVVQVARRPAAAGALVLLAAFSALILRRLAEGRRPPCACFGAWSVRPLGAGHVIRNAVLAVIAGVAILA